ncbi:MAG: ESX secretion-associated protein EspG [Actinomycetota bacterium]|nr:ESX secretion-associated protein EspG [Actinomycetota bacterium]
MNRSGVLRLSTVEFTALWRRMELGDRPLLLSVPDHGATLDERNQLDDQAWEQLRARGLVNARRPRPEIEDALGALAHPAVEADLRMITGPDQEVRVLACASGMVGVVGVPTTLTVDLIPAHPSRLAEALLTHVPDHPAAAGNSVMIPTELAQGVGLRADTEIAQLERAGLRIDDARQARRLISGRMVRRLKIGAAARDRLGRRHRARDVISVLDTEHGRIQIRRHGDQRGGGRLLLAPTGRQRLTSDIAVLIRSVVEAAAQH